MWVGERARARPPEAVETTATRLGAPLKGSVASTSSATLNWSARALGLAAVAQAERPRPPAPTEHAHHAREADGVARSADDESIDTDPRMLTLARMIEAITGMPVRTIRASDLKASPPDSHVGTAVPTAATQPGNPPSGWGLEYDRHDVATQTQSLAFSAGGTVRTADGQTIQFSLNMSLTTTHTEETHVSLRAGDAVLKDPLVLTFEGPVGALANTRFTFDLDADGTADQMPFVAQGSGFLVFDRNGNGAVDDGRELFGAQSGDGFADLAQFDDDGNGWIDTADAVFSRLQVWRLDDQGKPALSALASTGVGALYLNRVATPLALRDVQGNQQGQLRASSVYLTETGQVGSVQQIDLVA